MRRFHALCAFVFLFTSVAATVYAGDAVQTEFVRVAPKSEGERAEPSGRQKRVVVLIHGLRIGETVEQMYLARHQPWQQPDSVLVQQLSKSADVYSFAYGQNVTVEKIAGLPTLVEAVLSLHKAGYREIVLMGHSAGGLIARQFVEDHPEAGVTRVIQVCVPNAGCGLADFGVRFLPQKEFVSSLSTTARKKFQEVRIDKLLPADVQFLCVVGTSEKTSDGVVSVASQWSSELRKQGVPMKALAINHSAVMTNVESCEELAKLVEESHPRWTAEQVETACKSLEIEP